MRPDAACCWGLKSKGCLQHCSYSQSAGQIAGSTKEETVGWGKDFQVESECWVDACNWEDIAHTDGSWDHWDSSTQFLEWQWQWPSDDDDRLFDTPVLTLLPTYSKHYSYFILEVVVHVSVHLMLLDLVLLLHRQVLLLLIPDRCYFIFLCLSEARDDCFLVFYFFAVGLGEITGVVDGELVDLEYLQLVGGFLIFEPDGIDVHPFDETAEMFEVVQVLLLLDLIGIDHGDCSY